MSFIPKLRVKAVLTLAAVVLGAHSAAFAAPIGVSLTEHLKTLNLEPTNLGDFVKNKPAAIALGKALFWDMSVGSDGVQACASCHFSGGADNRTKNQISPGLNRKFQSAASNSDTTFSPHGPNYTLEAEDFPLHKVSDPFNRYSTVQRSSNDIVSSQGVASRDFANVIPGFPIDLTRFLADPNGFTVNGANVRRVEPRNTPSMINAVLNFRNFWDGRAQNDFNGVNPFGARDANAFLYKKDASGNLVKTTVSLNNSSLASQAVGPVLSFEEMSARNRPFAKVGVKLLPMQPLARQRVAADDSVLGPMSRAPNRGLNVGSYKTMVEAAFKGDWHDSNKFVRVNANGITEILSTAAGIRSKILGENTYTLAEFNFSLFFGLAVQMYESTLISDQTRFDRFLDGDETALNDQEKLGFVLFGNNTITAPPGAPALPAGPARCANCHGGPETTDASIFKVRQANNGTPFGTGVGQIRRRGGIGIRNAIDLGFNNIGVSPTLEDLGVGGNDPFDKPLSVARQTILNNDFTFIQTTDVLGVDGAFKIPMLRNVELTAPYFHNGDAKTLSEVVDFYFRGGNHQSAPLGNQVAPSTSTAIPPGTPLNTGAILGFDATRANPVNIAPLGTLAGPNFDNVPAQNTTGPLKAADRDAIVAFMLTMTDDRVKFRKAPFDHPELFVPNGHIGNESFVLNFFGTALDEFTVIPAVGQNGGGQLPKFLGLEQAPQ